MIDSLRAHGGLTPGREGKGREGEQEGKSARYSKSQSFSDVTREPRHGLTLAGDPNA